MTDAYREYFRYYGQKDDGSKVLLLDTLDFYSNHSAISMWDLGMTNDDVDYVLDRNVKKILSKVKEINIAVGAGYRLEIVMMVAYCLRKYKPFKILYVGGTLPTWMKGFVKLLHMFHADSRLYWLTQKCTLNEDYCINMNMPYEEVLLPQNTFDIVVLDDTDESLLTAMKETVILSLRVQGKIIVMSQRMEIMYAFIDGTAEKYDLGDGWQIGQRILSSEEIATMQADTIDGSVAMILQEVLQRITLVREALLLTDVDMDVLLQTADEVEQYILLSYAALPSLEAKYLVNEWKRALLDCRLGWGSISRVKKYGDALLTCLQ